MSKTKRRYTPVSGKWHVLNYYPEYAEEFKEKTGATYEEYYSRDGKSGWGYRKKQFKTACKKKLRLENRRLCINVYKGEDYEDMYYPDVCDTKPFIWDYF